MWLMALYKCYTYLLNRKFYIAEGKFEKESGWARQTVVYVSDCVDAAQVREWARQRRVSTGGAANEHEHILQLPIAADLPIH